MESLHCYWLSFVFGEVLYSKPYFENDESRTLKNDTVKVIQAHRIDYDPVRFTLIQENMLDNSVFARVKDYVFSDYFAAIRDGRSIISRDLPYNPMLAKNPSSSKILSLHKVETTKKGIITFIPLSIDSLV